MQRCGFGCLDGRPLAETEIGVPHFQVDVHIPEPGTDRYRGRLCEYRECPKARKEACLVDGCGAQPFLRQFRDYTFDRFEFRNTPKKILFERDPSPDSELEGAADVITVSRITDEDVPF